MISEKKKLICLIILIIIFFVIVLMLIKLFQEIYVIKSEQLSRDDSYNEFVLQKDLINQIITYNLAYLGISITIILLIGGIFYIFNLKPFEENMKEQEKVLTDLKEKTIKSLSKEQQDNLQQSEKRLEKQINSLKEDAIKIINLIRDENKEENKNLREIVEKKINEEIQSAIKIIEELKLSADKKIFGLVNKYRELELDMIWDSHNMWRLTHIYTISFKELIRYLEKGLEYNITFLFNLCLDSMEQTLNQFKEKDFLKDEDFIMLQNALGRVVGFADKKSTILKIARSKTKNL